MSPEEFVIWLKGFAEAANPYNVTPKQWEAVKEKLESVEVDSFEDEYEITEDGEVVTIATISGEPDWYITHT